MNEIIPTILTSDIEDFSRKMNSLKGVCSRVQIDISDGKFFGNKTVDLEAIRDLGETGDFKVDLHLMVEEPQGWISRALEIVPDRIIAQVEKTADPLGFVHEVIESGTQVGLAVDLETPLDFISEDIYLLTDLILLLGVRAGKGGQEFDPRVLEKIKKMRGILGELGKIGVDGGLNSQNIILCKNSGANIYCVGNSLWQAEDLEKRYNELLGLISKS